MTKNTVKTVFCIISTVVIFCAFPGAGAEAASLQALKAGYESEFSGYMKLLIENAGENTLEKKAATLIEAKERYLAALLAEAEQLEKTGDSEKRDECAAVKNEMLKLQKSAILNSAGLKIQPLQVSSSAKTAKLKTAAASAGAKTGAARITDGRAASSSSKTSASSGRSSFFQSVGSFFKKIKNAVGGFLSSAGSFVKQTFDGIVSDKYEDNVSSNIPGSLQYAEFDGADFYLGANFPWLPGGYGWDIGNHDSWGSKFNEKIVDETFANFAAKKLKILRWFLYCDGRANPKFDAAAGLFKYPDARFMADFDKIMALAKKHDIKIVWSFLDFHWFKKDSANFAAYSKIASDAALQKDFIEKAIMPIVKKYADDGAIFAWEVINEPEWITSNVVAPGAPGAISVAELQALVKNATAAIKSASAKPVTVGSAKPQWMYLYVNTGIDMFQAHYYDKGSKIPKKIFSAFEFKKKYNISAATPVILGEFASRGSRYTIGQYINMAKDSGYDGAWVWGYHSTDEATDRSKIDSIKFGE
jgi:hypothetical protein